MATEAAASRGALRPARPARPAANGARRSAAAPASGSAAGPGWSRRGPNLLARLGAAAALELQRRLPRSGLDDRDPDYIRDNLPWLWLMASYYFRADVRGMENIPESGPVLLTGNHSGGNVIADTFVFTLAFSTRFGVERPFYQLAHQLVLAYPDIFGLRKFGTIVASHENAERALAADAAVLVYPGGDYETHRPSWESAKVDFGGRKGFIRLALASDVPIVPVVAIGGQETALFLSRGEGLARALRLDRMLRLKVLPISLAIPWGLNVGDLLLHVPLPAKITVEVLPPINVRERFGDAPDLDEVYHHVVAAMQRTLSRLAGERRLPVVG